MIKEYEGKTEKEAIDKAIDELGIDREEFDVELVDSSRKGLLFRKGNVKIRIHISDEDLEDEDLEDKEVKTEPKDETEEKIIRFIETCIENMGFPGEVVVTNREENKLTVSINSNHSGILIGKKGKNLDALQLLVNVVAGRLNDNLKVIVDAEGYRGRREETIVRLARKAAEEVKRNHKSRLLEPMNPFERRLIHTSLNQMRDIATKSEGEGLYKQVRIYYTG